jgi:plastocyanin
MKQHTVAIRSAFDPQTINIVVGDAIVWVNQTLQADNVSSDDGGQTFMTGPVQAGASSLPITFVAEDLKGVAYSSTSGLHGLVVVEQGQGT